MFVYMCLYMYMYVCVSVCVIHSRAKVSFLYEIVDPPGLWNYDYSNTLPTEVGTGGVYMTSGTKAI